MSMSISVYNLISKIVDYQAGYAYCWNCRPLLFNFAEPTKRWDKFYFKVAMSKQQIQHTCQTLVNLCAFLRPCKQLFNLQINTYSEKHILQFGSNSNLCITLYYSEKIERKKPLTTYNFLNVRLSARIWTGKLLLPFR